MTDPYVVDWIKQTDLMNTSGNDNAPSIVSDSDGSVYVAYTTNGTVSGGEISENTGTNIVVMKMTNTGVVDWIKQDNSFNSIVDEGPPSITVDSDNNIYVTYRTQGVVPYGETLGVASDIVVMKMHKNDGSIEWVKQDSSFNTTAGEYSTKIVADSTGVYVSYVTRGITTGLGNILSGGTYDIAVMKMNTDGTVVWIKQNGNFNTSGSDTYPSIAVDSTGVYVTYMTTGKVSGEGNTFSGVYDIVVFKLNKDDGSFAWAKQTPSFNTLKYDSYPSIAADENNYIYVVYSTAGSVLDDGNTKTSIGFDIVVMKMNTDGTVVWIKQNGNFNTTDNLSTTPSIAVNSTGVYVAYNPTGSVPGYGNTNSGGTDIVVFKLNKDGSFGWAKQTSSFNTSGDEGPPSIYANSDGSIYVTYSTTGIVLGGEISESTGTNIVVMKLKNPPTICLLEGTLVRTPTGSVPIELVKKDDYVLNQDYKPVRVVLTSKTTFQYKTDPTTKFDMDNVLYTIPAGTLGATSNVYLTKHHRFMTSDGTMKKPEEYGLKRSELSEVCKTSDLYTVYHLRLEDEYNNHFIVNGDCIVEDWWDWPRPNVV